MSKFLRRKTSDLFILENVTFQSSYIFGFVRNDPNRDLICSTCALRCPPPQQGGGVPEQYDRLIGETPLFFRGNECNSSVAPSDFDRLISGYRLA